MAAMRSDSPLFACTQCGDCCHGFGGSYLTAAEMNAIAGFLGLSVAEFIKAFCAPSGRRYVLTQGADGYCIFYQGNCTIHAVKPRMCRQWPYIPGVLVDIANWRVMAALCPGINVDLDDEYIEACVRKKLGNYSEHFIFGPSGLSI